MAMAMSYDWLFHWHYNGLYTYVYGFLSTYNWYNSGPNKVAADSDTKNPVLLGGWEHVFTFPVSGE